MRMTPSQKRDFIIARNRSRRFWRTMRAISRNKTTRYTEKRDVERIERTRKMEEDRVAAQAIRIMRQCEQEYRRAYGTRGMSGAIAGLDVFERKRKHLDAKWQSKWILRKRKMDHRCHSSE